MNLISEDYLMHHGVKGMKWGVRKDPRVQNAYNKRENAYAKYHSINYAKAKHEITHPSFLIRGTEANRKSNELYKQSVKQWAKVVDASGNYNDTKRLVKNERKVSKYSEKAKNKAGYERDLANNIKKHGDWEDDEFFDSLSPSEQKAEWDRSKKVAAQYFKTANYWDKAANSISKTKTKKEAKNLYKKYWHNAPEW